jgi:hypothetical protein
MSLLMLARNDMQRPRANPVDNLQRYRLGWEMAPSFSSIRERYQGVTPSTLSGRLVPLLSAFVNRPRVLSSTLLVTGWP